MRRLSTSPPPTSSLPRAIFPTMNTNTDWLKRRGVSTDIIESFGIHTDNALGLENCLVIPVHAPDGTFLFNKYRRDPSDPTKPKYLYDKGGRVTLYGANHLPPTIPTSVVITEGELDALVLWSMNIPAVSSTGGALSFQPEWVDDILKGIRDIYVCLDNDDAGAEGMVKIHQYIPSARFVFIPEQPHIKDITDFIERGGDFVNLMATALQYPTEESIIDDMNKRAASWLPTRFHTAWIKKHHEQAQRTAHHETARRTSSDKVLNARQYPITKLLKFNRDRKTICPFHLEKTPSLHYYPKTNTTYCFGGCGKAYDAIAIYQKQSGATFVEAVRFLNQA